MSSRTAWIGTLAAALIAALAAPEAAADGMAEISNYCNVQKTKKIKRYKNDHLQMLQTGPDSLVYYHVQLLGGQPTRPIDFDYFVDVSCFPRDAASAGGGASAEGTVTLGPLAPRDVSPIALPCTGSCDCFFETETRGATRGKWKKKVDCDPEDDGDLLIDDGFTCTEIDDCKPTGSDCSTHAECCSGSCQLIGLTPSCG